jgi:signal transduction histidine kinase
LKRITVSTERRQGLLERYRASLDTALCGTDEAVLERAYEIGRAALDEGFGIADLALVHHQALRLVLARGRTAEEALRTAETADLFFIESLSPFEMSFRGYREANTALRSINQILEDEARRVARELHDETAQLLVSAHLELAALARKLGPEAAARFERIRGLLDSMDGQLRRLSHEIRPPLLDQLGLRPALELLAQNVTARGKVDVRVTGDTGGRLGPTAETTFYRIVDEALQNVARHAKAKQALVELRREEGRVLCSVRDDGVGFDAPALMQPGGTSGIGLLGIRERLQAVHGSLEIRSTRGVGTELRVAVPIES